MDNREVAIQVTDVKKQYVLGQIGGGSLQRELQSWWAKKRGKEDPNTRIGQKERIKGSTFMALNGIDLTVYKGEALGIIGRNGAGKSTLLKLLSRVTAPTEGEIDIYGRITSMLEVGTGFNGQMTGRENIYMNGAILGMSKAEIDSKMDDIIEFSEVRDFIDTPVKRYSSGMYVKLAFSVAAHLDSEIMIMDEVLAVGDMAFQEKCLNKMRDVAKKEGKTILYVSHNMNTIRKLCDRCIVLNEGQIIYDGEVEKAIDVYMHNSKDQDVKKDYSNIERPPWIYNQKVKITEAEFLNRTTTSFLSTDEMIIRLKWINLSNISDIGIRFEIRTIDNTPQCTCVAYKAYSGNEGDTVTLDATLDISMLKPAEYRFYFTLFDQGQYGAGADIDWVQGLYFDIVSDEKDRLTWNPKNWGYIEMPAPIVKLS